MEDTIKNKNLHNSAMILLSKDAGFYNTCKTEKSKLFACKRLKSDSGLSLRECKDIIDYFFDNPVKIDRYEKLKQLSKVSLVDKLLASIEDIELEKLKSVLLKLDVDILLTIDELIESIENVDLKNL